LAKIKLRTGLEVVMLRLHFTTEDLVRTRFAEAPAPLLETTLAVAMLRRPGGLRPLKQNGIAAVRSFPVSARPLLDLIQPTGCGLAFLDPPTTDLDEGLDLVRSTPRALVRSELTRCLPDRLVAPSWVAGLLYGDDDVWSGVRRALRDFFRSVLAPIWAENTTVFHSDIAERSTVMSRRGLEGVFNGLHPRLRWGDGVLLIDSPVDRDMAVGGHGLVLIPSPSWTGPLLMRPPLLEPEPFALIYPARPLRLPDGEDRLAATLGHTRAAALRTLRRPCGTRELARRLWISEASASLQAKALRDSGLIITERHGRAVRHSLTRLGQRMLAGV
jgi:DNA-binding transcriptional ArsR family regulator